jgi:hypothetical protein
VVVLGGLVAFAVGSFLPFFGLATVVGQEEPFSPSFYRQVVLGNGNAAVRVGGFLWLFGGLGVVAAVSIAALTGAKGGWTRLALVGAVAAWTVGWAGTLLNQAGQGYFSLEAGYWVMWVGVAIVAAGTLMVMIRPAGRVSGPAEAQRSRRAT